jgi:DNA polymerase-1
VSQEPAQKTLLLVDGSSYLYRAFHALPELKNPRGEPTGAIYGVANMLRRLASDYRAQARVCVFDAKGRTFRDDEYPEYKATRAPMPDDLSRQIEPLIDTVKALGWPVLSVSGVEADDVIATLAEQARSQGWQCVISTGDKDLAQLVDAQVTLVNTMSNETLDEAGVLKKFGVPAARIVDYLALVGDAIDNVPGVAKVGPKTAVKWIAEYGSLDGVIANADRIGGAIGENLRKALPWLPTGRRLLTVKRDVPLECTLEQLARDDADDGLQRANLERLRALVEGFGFKTWLREIDRLLKGGGDDAAASPDGAPVAAARVVQAPVAPRGLPHELIADEEALRQWVAALDGAALSAFAVHADSDEPMLARLVGLSFALGERSAYLPLAHDYAGAPAQIAAARALELLRPWFESARHRKLGHNLKFDAHVLAGHGLRLAGIAHDVLLESYVVEVHERHDLDSLAERHLGVRPIRLEDLTGKGAGRIPYASVEIERAAAYGAQRSGHALAVHALLHPRLAAEAALCKVYEAIEMPVLQVLFRMECNGVLLDSARLEAQSHELGKEMLEIEQKAFQAAGQPFNLNSPKQIQEILFERQGLPVKKKTPSGQPSTDEDVLAELALDYPLPRLLLDYRALTKLKSTYTDKLPRMVNASTGRVHTTYGQAVAVTGRLSSNDPNLQNIPIRTAQGRRVREAFIAPPGCRILSADYSQVELRIMAHLSGDAGLRHAFAMGHDVHSATAAEVFGRQLEEVTQDERRTAKMINFGLIYGMSAFGLAQNLGIERATAQAYMDSYFSRYPGVRQYMEATRERARSLGYVETVLGRRLWLPEMKSGSPARRAGAERAAINAPMQGTAADLIKLAMISVQEWLDEAALATRLIMQVHDELVLEVPEAEIETIREGVRARMQDVAKLDVPLIVDIGVGSNWDEAH